MNRRGFLLGLCAPAIIRPGLLMPIKPLLFSRYYLVTKAVAGNYELWDIMQEKYSTLCAAPGWFPGDIIQRIE